MLKKLAAPFIVLTMGIALFVVNLIGVYLAAAISTGFVLDDFDAAITVTFFLWIANSLLHLGFAWSRRSSEKESPRRANAR